ncbi:MAG: hypothetical protein ABEJ42_00245 [Halobacteriaceae archaeon]
MILNRRKLITIVGVGGAGGLTLQQLTDCESPDPTSLQRTPLAGTAPHESYRRGLDEVEYDTATDTVRFPTLAGQPKEQWASEPVAEYVTHVFDRLLDRRLEALLTTRLGASEAAVEATFDGVDRRAVVTLRHWVRDGCIVTTPDVSVEDVVPLVPSRVTLTAVLDGHKVTETVPAVVRERYRTAAVAESG